MALLLANQVESTVDDVSLHQPYQSKLSFDMDLRGARPSS